MKWSYKTIFSNEMNYKRTNNFYFYSDEMKLIVTYLAQNFFHKHQTVSVKENYWQQFFFPPILAKIQFFFFSPRNLIATTQLFFSHSYFGNEIATIQLFFLPLSSILAMKLP